MTGAKARPCSAVTKERQPCSAQARPGRSVCVWHDEELSQRRAEWSKKGGAGRSALARARRDLPKTLADVAPVLYRTLTALESGDMEPQRATAMAAVSRALVAVAEAADLEERVAVLSARVTELEAS